MRLSKLIAVSLMYTTNHTNNLTLQNPMRWARKLHGTVDLIQLNLMA